MFDSLSALGFFVQIPCGPRKSGTPDSVEMPAPVNATMRVDEDTQLRTRSIWFATSSVYTRRMSLTPFRLIGWLATMVCAISCASSEPPSPPVSSAPSGNAAFDEVSRSDLERMYGRQTSSNAAFPEGAELTGGDGGSDDAHEIAH